MVIPFTLCSDTVIVEAVFGRIWVVLNAGKSLHLCSLSVADRPASSHLNLPVTDLLFGRHAGGRLATWRRYARVSLLQPCQDMDTCIWLWIDRHPTKA